jgi:hypothetical protein
VVAYNLLAVWVGGLTGWWGLYDRGWPLELLAIGLGLSVIMYGTGSIWLLIPTAIVLGHGLIFAYCQTVGRWTHYAFLWPLEPVLILGSIFLTIRLARRGKATPEVARPIGCALGATAIVWGIITALATLAISMITHVIG